MCIRDRALTGKKGRERHVITSLELDAHRQEDFNKKLQAKYRKIEANEVRFEKILCEDADYLIIAYGSAARICQKSIDLAREAGIKIGSVSYTHLLDATALFPDPVSRQ